ncbi:hypothetical protein COCMIDRAFT_109326, partial [Bipolaris oryzae ATCC 44560]
KKKQHISDARLRESLQNLDISQDEAQGLRNQVQALQKELLAQVSKVEVVSDETLSRDFRILASLVKSLSRSIQPTQDSPMLHTLGFFVLVQDVAKHHWNTRARQKAYVEASIWSMLIDGLFHHPFEFCRPIEVLNEDWRLIFAEEFFDDWPTPTPESESWRLTTVNTLISQIGRETTTTGQCHEDSQELSKKVRSLQKGVFKKRESVANTIRSHLTAISTGDHSNIPGIVDQAFKLAFNMSMQPFRVQITWPDVGADFEADHMSSVPDRNGQDIRRGVVAFIVNPGLTRWGDAHGQNFEKRHEIVPSLVQLEPVQVNHKYLRSRVIAKQEEEHVQR